MAHPRKAKLGLSFLKGQDLAGVLPPSIAKLPYLTQIDFSRNFISGNIPSDWAATKLEFMSLSVNNLSGPIPAFLGNITTLRNLSLDTNMFSGNVPPEIGKLVNLQILVISANNLTGVLPVDLTNLTKLIELRISSNNFRGRIPDFFRSWSQLNKLEIQASGLQGPIPSSISVLSNLTELRISDLNGGCSEFPNLTNMKSMTRLMLRSCNLSGQIPDLKAMTVLNRLDLSFNRLEGSFPDVEAMNVQYFTIDVSYNNFSKDSEPSTCSENLNVFKSSSAENNSVSGVCLENYSCKEVQYSLHINCGGGATIGRVNYEDDKDLGGGAKFVPRSNWGTSSTGVFWDTNVTAGDYIAKNVSTLGMKNSQLYMNARLSPLSLTYYANCLAQGNYTVSLHFAEIIIRGNKSYQSVGRRIFDVYIQEKLVLKDFDIVKEAKGVDKEVIKETKAVQVKNKTLEIRFHWSGKGTTASPRRGIYGPLISAISIESEFKHSKRKIYVVVGVSVGASILCLVFLILAFFGGEVVWWIARHQGKKVLGYMAPEYALWGCLTYKADVYSFGVVALEIVSGKNNMKYRPHENIQCLMDWAHVLHKKGNLLELVDQRLGSDFKKKEALRTIKVALLCANPTAALRPIMSAVVSMLEGRTPVDEVALDPSIHGDEMTRLRAFENLSEQNAQGISSTSESHSLVLSSDAPWTASSDTTSSDLYKVYSS
ncbi:PREDICTED: probable LRR receptor-like serine/threonine-protein kinase At1g07650-like [Fragaria vesca subsp. vesca]